MLCSTQSLTRLSALVLIGLGAVVIAPDAIAQNTSTSSGASAIDPLGDLRIRDDGSDSSNPLSNPLNLIHRAVLGNPVSLEEFQQTQQGRISDEASDFRRRQQEALRQESQNSSSDETIPSSL